MEFKFYKWQLRYLEQVRKLSNKQLFEEYDFMSWDGDRRYGRDEFKWEECRRELISRLIESNYLPREKLTPRINTERDKT